jgi:hypothetical protein
VVEEKRPSLVAVDRVTIWVASSSNVGGKERVSFVTLASSGPLLTSPVPDGTFITVNVDCAVFG